MTLSRQSVLCLGGLTVIVLTNALILGGVALNRSQQTSRIELTERELAVPAEWENRYENGGLRLRLILRDGAEAWDLLSGRHNLPAWLDEEKLQALGFPVGQMLAIEADDHRGRNEYRSVVLVAELDGPAYRKLLQRARDAYEEKLAQAGGGEKAGKPGAATFLARSLRREQALASRLVLVDAGTDVAALRSAYPDRDRYLILGGRIGLFTAHFKEAVRLHANVQADVPRLNVPLRWRSTLQQLAGRPLADDAAGPRFRADLAYGTRLEPWLLDIAPAD